MHGDKIDLILAAVSTNVTVLLSFSLLVMGVLFLVLWVKFYRLHALIRDIVSDLQSAAHGKAGGESLSFIDLKHQMKAALDEMHKHIAEEAARITMLQKMVLDFKDNHSTRNLVMEKSFQVTISQLSSRMDSIERRSKQGEPSSSGDILS